MSQLEIQFLDVWYLSRHGHAIACGLSEDDLYEVAPSLRKDVETEVTTTKERVGIVEGEVLDWSKRGGHSFTPKLHWTCPQCGQQWWEDFDGAVKNPHFADSGCECVAYWLVNWSPEQAAGELGSG